MAERASFNWDPLRATAVNGDFANCMAGKPWGFVPNDLAQGLMYTMFQAEMMAAAEGVVPFVQVGTQKGVTSVGLARQYVSEMSPETRAIYLAAHGSCRQANAAVGMRQTSTPYGSQPIDGSLEGAFPVVPIICLAVAAIVATAGYLAYTKGKEIETEGGNLRNANAAATWAKTAQQALAGGQKLPPDFWTQIGSLGGVADKEAKSGSPWWAPVAVVGGVAIVGTVTLVGWQNRALVRRAFR